MPQLDPLVFFLVVLCGLVVGVLSGMLGIGGGSMVIPLLNVVFGLPITTASSTSLLTIAPTALSGAVKHVRQKTAHLKVSLLIGAFGAASSSIGALVQESVPDIIVALLAVAIIYSSAIKMLFESRKQTEEDIERANQQRERLNSRKSTVICIGLGLFVGVLAGIVGVGGGFIIVPFTISYLGFTMKEAAGTSLLAIGIVAIPGIVTHALLGQIAWLYGLALVIGSIPGAQIGAWLITKLPDRPMRIAFGCLLVITGALLILNNVGVL